MKKGKDGRPGVSLDWFNMLYQVLLGQEKGPRFGSFVAVYGVENAVGMIDGALARRLGDCEAVVSFLRAEGFVVILFQPIQVHAYARFTLRHAKNDKIDAALIARCTAAATDQREPPDPRLAPLAQHLTMIEQLTEDVAQLKTRLEACRDARIRVFWQEEIKRLKRLVADELEAADRRHSSARRSLPAARSDRQRGRGRPADRGRHPGAHARDRPRQPRAGSRSRRPCSNCAALTQHSGGGGEHQQRRE